MKNIQFITFLLVLFLALVFNQGIAQDVALVQASPDQAESHWIFARSPENNKPLANPLTTHFSVLPRITVNDDGKVFVYIFNPNHVAISIGLLDQDGNTLHQDKTANLYYGKLLNVSELEAGEYKLTLHSDSVSARYEVKIRSQAREIKVNEAAAF